MSDTSQKSDKSGSNPKAKSDEKQARLAEALRANLRRRKAQAKDRKSDS